MPTQICSLRLEKQRLALTALTQSLTDISYLMAKGMDELVYEVNIAT